MALLFRTILAALIFFFIGLLIYTFINGGLPGGKKIKEDAKDTSMWDAKDTSVGDAKNTSVEDSEEDWNWICDYTIDTFVK